MKKIGSVLAFVSLFIIACSDPCSDIDCGANGTCIEGVCNCDEAYTGVNCETEIRAKYLGIFEGDFSACLGGLVPPDQIPDGLGTASATVTSDPDNIWHVIISTPFNTGMDNTISVNPESGSFNLPAITQTLELEQIPFPITITVTGNGEFLSEDQLRLNFTIIIPLVQSIECTIDMNKQ
ncbi:MAG: calcium-binding EGF-like domain-containing protein [Saprospiraceae bacterium]|jgi:hypothetical protein|nr:hypothetical protein [Chitinophagia bacterium]